MEYKLEVLPMILNPKILGAKRFFNTVEETLVCFTFANNNNLYFIINYGF